MSREHVFLLSPAMCRGRRAQILLRDGATLPMAQRLHAGELPLGEAFSFLSGLYFRGKLAYGRTFGSVPGDLSPTLVITPSRGLMDPAALVDTSVIREFASVEVELDNPTYRAPLDRDAAALASRLGGDSVVVLLGSIATGKYVDALAPWFGERLRFPAAFVGRGDMSRGGLLLRSVASREELTYECLRPGVRLRGARPPRLTRPLKGSAASS